MSGCALLPIGRFHRVDGPTAAAGADGDAVQTDDQAHGAAGDPAGGDPGSSMPQAIPDPLHSIAHPVGETVEITGASITFLGLERSGDQLRARFAVHSGSVTGARLLSPSGEIADLHTIGGDLVSDAFGSAASPPSKTAHLTLVVGDRLYLFEAGAAD